MVWFQGVRTDYFKLFVYRHYNYCSYKYVQHLITWQTCDQCSESLSFQFFFVKFGIRWILEKSVFGMNVKNPRILFFRPFITFFLLKQHIKPDSLIVNIINCILGMIFKGFFLNLNSTGLF